MEITAGIHLLQATKGSYVYLVLGDEPILIDTSFPGRTRAILTEIEKLGLRPTDIAHILLTHQDGDHIGNAHALQQASGAQVWASQEDLPYVFLFIEYPYAAWLYQLFTDGSQLRRKTVFLFLLLC